MFNVKSKFLLLSQGAGGVIGIIRPHNLAVSSEGVNFLLGELPHIKGKAELMFQNEKKSDIGNIMNSLRGLLVAHRDDLYAKISAEISAIYRNYINQSSQPDLLTWIDPNVEVILEEIKDILPRERVNLIFQEAFNTSATALENFVIGFIHTITKEKAEM